jgi:hypothetical protein
METAAFKEQAAQRPTNKTLIGIRSYSPHGEAFPQKISPIVFKDVSDNFDAGLKRRKRFRSTVKLSTGTEPPEYL